MVILSGEEFYGHSELPGALAEARNVFEFYCKRLKESLTAGTHAVIPVDTEIQMKEAA